MRKKKLQLNRCLIQLHGGTISLIIFSLLILTGYGEGEPLDIISKSYKSPDILDVATGTGDLAIAAMKLNPLKITGIDISNKMLCNRK